MSHKTKRLVHALPPIVEPMFFCNVRSTPDRQARQLFGFGMISQQWLWLNGLEEEEGAWKVAESLDAMIQRGIRGGSAWMRAYRPHGIRILTKAELIFYADYTRTVPPRFATYVTHVRAGKDSVQQTRAILTSGAAAKKCLIISGDYEYARALALLLDCAIQNGTYRTQQTGGYEPRNVCLLRQHEFHVLTRYEPLHTLRLRQSP